MLILVNHNRQFPMLVKQAMLVQVRGFATIDSRNCNQVTLSWKIALEQLCFILRSKPFDFVDNESTWRLVTRVVAWSSSPDISLKPESVTQPRLTWPFQVIRLNPPATLLLRRCQVVSYAGRLQMMCMHKTGAYVVQAVALDEELLQATKLVRSL